MHYLALLAEQSALHGCDVHAYVLMSNHVHLLVTPSSDHSVSRMMKAVGERYVRAFNKRHRRTGTLWEGRFKSTIVDSAKYLFTLYRYIEMNPVRAGLVSHPSQYAWSSYGVNANGEESKLITPHPLFLAIADDEMKRRGRYRAMFGEPLTEDELNDIRAALSGGFALGGAVHHGAIESHTGMRSQRKRRLSDAAAAAVCPRISGLSP